MRALIIVDMQNAAFTPLTQRYDSVFVINRINQLSEKFRINEDCIIYVQHDGTYTGELIPNTPEWEILDDLVIEDTDVIIHKTANDSFYNTDLDATLKILGINDLFITGCATDFCVESTIQSAIIKNYNVNVVSDAHTTGDRPHISAENCIKHYNWIWSNMIPARGNIRVLKTEDII